MSKNLGDFLSLGRLKSLSGYLVCREIVTRLQGSIECYNPNDYWDVTKLSYKFKEPISKHLNYILDTASFCPSIIHYDGGYNLTYHIKIDNTKLTLIIEGLIIRKKLDGTVVVVSSFESKTYLLVNCGGKKLGLSGSVLDNLTEDLTSNFTKNCINDRDTLKWLCYYHILNSISKKTKINEPIGYTTGAFANDILTRIYVRSEEKKIKYEGEGTYTVNNKIRFTICGKPEVEDECFDFIEETTEQTNKIKYELHGKYQFGLSYISDQADLIKRGLEKILGLSY